MLLTTQRKTKSKVHFAVSIMVTALVIGVATAIAGFALTEVWPPIAVIHGHSFAVSVAELWRSSKSLDHPGTTQWAQFRKLAQDLGVLELVDLRLRLVAGFLGIGVIGGIWYSSTRRESLQSLVARFAVDVLIPASLAVAIILQVITLSRLPHADPIDLSWGSASSAVLELER